MTGNLRKWGVLKTFGRTFVKQFNKFFTLALLVLTIGFNAHAAIFDCSGLLFSKSQSQGTSPESRGFRSEALTVVTADGISLRSILIHTHVSPPRGLIVQFHGYGGNSAEVWIALEWLLNAGYDLLASEYRGHNGSEGKATIEGGLEDVRAGLHYANGMATRLDIPLIGVGHSIGGHLLYKAVSTGKYSRLRVVLTEGAPVSMLQTVKEMTSQLPQPYKTLARLSPLLIPKSTTLDPQELGQVGSILKIVVHAPTDRMVSPAQAEALYSSLLEPKLKLSNLPDEHAVGFSEPIQRDILDAMDGELSKK